MAETNKNKVKFKLLRAYYAVATESDDGGMTYGNPKRIPGAVSLSMSPEGDQTPLKADGIDYFVANTNNGYSGDLEVALLPDEFRTECLGETIDETSKVLVEKNNAESKPFAFMFEFSGDKHAVKHVMYRCFATRPNVEGENPDNNEAKTESITIKAVPRDDGMVKAKTTDSTTTEVVNAWYSSVWEPTAG